MFMTVRDECTLSHLWIFECRAKFVQLRGVKTLRHPPRHTVSCKEDEPSQRMVSSCLSFLVRDVSCNAKPNKACNSCSTMSPMLLFTGRPIKSQVMRHLLS